MKSVVYLQYFILLSKGPEKFVFCFRWSHRRHYIKPEVIAAEIVYAVCCFNKLLPYIPPKFCFHAVFFDRMSFCGIRRKPYS